VQHVEVSRDFAAPVERVWACYTDHRGWSRWARLGRVTLAREGQPTADGVGCVRVIGSGLLAVHEEVRVFEPPNRMVYALVKGAVPIRNHEGEVTFATLPDGQTRITWRCRFDSIVPGLGPVIRGAVARMFAQVLARMASQLS
jgi:uncharacterized protein YndB with AHSA1/START domain